MRDKIQEIVVQAVAGTKDITEAIDDLHNLTTTEYNKKCECGGGSEVIVTCEDCLYKMINEGN